ncbi:hypothetical protein CONCODRAFT_77387 [Conidiobolus coronatus NRRL 28638]|uniref:Uncharacterized protein n=1 Tax=Conidiobolus coronatus (strain ATCC 28846 / CBS 209.66 / NRRL 28638) TaxID=796925 RepID=A0A137PED8_CONC2|nr:hypothetical protein CONCODRAFT_77387 [Conidiobolus coronatus NRRL 28638]|eukprot:KXN73335.1 hypothetical protein CONCODRAFT_77387 [Conidiobolus coronatus NRRL 28638]
MNNKKQNQVKISNRSDLFNDNETSGSESEFDEVGQNQLDQLMKMSLFQAEEEEEEESEVNAVEAESEQAETEAEQAEAEPEVEKEEEEEEGSQMTFRLFSNLPAKVISTKAQELSNPIQKKTIEDYTYKATEEELKRFSQVAVSFDQIIEGSLETWETKQYPKRLISINLKQVNTPITKKSKNNGKQKIDHNLSSPYLAKKLFKPEFKGKKVDRVHLRF